MLNSGKKFRALRDKKINILTLVLSEKKILNETDLDKFFFIFRSNDYDINMCCIKGISEMYKYRNSLM